MNKFLGLVLILSILLGGISVANARGGRLLRAVVSVPVKVFHNQPIRKTLRNKPVRNLLKGIFRGC